LFRWTARHNTPLTIVAAGLVPVLYLIFIGSYAVNSFQADDWSLVPLVHAALHGGLSLGQLWEQHNESRLLVGNVIDVLFGFTDRLDARAIIFFSAGVFIAAYVCLLMLARKYLPTRLTPITVVIIGVLWFSLADIQNILWAFQVSWYLTVFFFVAMLYSLLVPERHRVLWFAAAVLLAVASSLSTVQGFISWPIGAICILWPGPSRRGRSEIAIWFGTMLGTVAAYLPGYRFNQGNTCVAAARCTTSFELHHPLTSASFFFALIGNVIPGPIAGFSAHLASPARFVVVGLALFAAALFVLVQSWRLRGSSEALPLPALLIVFGLLFDLTIAVGRSGSGIAEAVTFNRYVMANLILLTGIVLYALARVPPIASRLSGSGSWRVSLTFVAVVAVALFVVVQVTEATRFGVANGRTTRTERIVEARFLVNANSHPSCRRLDSTLWEAPTATLLDAAEDHLGEFSPSLYRHYRALGPPPVNALVDDICFPGAAGSAH
jgi:hypothetical protein